jgi:lysophospholipase L1-like esterase
LVGSNSEEAAVEIDDRLVVALGDSVASGEGNPDRQGRWLDPPCHRSSTAGFEQAARLLGEAMTRRSITFVSLACSGAAIDQGLLERYGGVAPEPGRRYEPQVERLERLADVRGAGPGNQPPVDAVLLSVGANDVHFSEVVKACALPGNCRRSHDEAVFAELEALGDSYDTLAGELEVAAPGAPC